jgi:predicted lipoprotein
MKNFSGTLLFLSITVMLFSGCSEESTTNQSSNFDRQTFLEFIVNEQILPAATNLDSQAVKLNAIVANFNSTPSSEQINEAKATWLSLASAWQYMHIFDFGASELPTGNLGEEIATFPVSEAKILNYVGNEDYLFQNFDRDTRGIYAIEYFLFAENADLSMPNQLAYLKALTARVAEQTTTIQQRWSTSGKEDFLSQNGTDAGSSLSNLVNAMAKSYEAIKNFKLGIPLGLRPGQNSQELSRMEGYYSDVSLSLITTHFNALSNVWKGNANFSSRTGLGFEEYLESVFGGQELKESSLSAISEIEQKLSLIDTQGSLKQAIDTNQNAVIELHNLFQQHTRFFKSDLASLLGVSITFNSGDGD